MNARRSVALTQVVDLAVDTLAAYRITRLVTSDVLTAGARATVIERAYRRSARAHGETLSARVGQSVHGMSTDDWLDMVVLEGADAPKVAYLVTCQWCVGVWVAAGVVAARRLVPGWPLVARALAVAGAQSIIVAAQ